MTKNTFFETITQLIGRKSVAFEPVAADDDELIKAIETDPVFQDNHWDLHEDIDGEALQSFWDKAAKDLSRDN